MKKIAAVLISAVTFSSVAFASSYTDNKPNEAYYNSIEFATEQGIVSGNPDGSFKPYQEMNRAELLKIIVEATYTRGSNPELVEYMGLDVYWDDNCFTDVPAKEWYTKYVCYAKDAGIIQGYSDGTFRPSNKVNLVEALKMTLGSFGYDYAESNPWYKGLVESASAYNFIPLTFTNFNQTVMRGEMTDIVTRILKYENGEFEDFYGIYANQRITYETLKNGTGAVKYDSSTNILDDNSVIIYQEEISSEISENRSWPIKKVWIKEGNNEPEVLINSVGEVGQYPNFYKLSPDKNTLLLSLESKIVGVDLDNRNQVYDVYTPDIEIEDFEFSKDGKSLIIWEQDYASSNYDYQVVKYDFETESSEVLHSGNTGGKFLFIWKWVEDENFLILWSAYGEATQPWYFNLETGEMASTPGFNKGLDFKISETGKYVLQPDGVTENICNDFSTSAPNGFNFFDPISGDYKTGVTYEDKIMEIVMFSPDDTEVIFSLSDPETDYTKCPVSNSEKTFYLLDLQEEASVLLNDYQAKIKEWYPEYVDVSYSDDYSTLYFDGVPYSISSPKYSLVFAFIKK